MAKTQSFRKRERLHRNSDFARVYGARRSAGDGTMTVYVAQNGLNWSRIGISVSRRAGSAVQRSYIRRRIREAFRTHKGEIPRGLDIVCVAKSAAADKSKDLAESLLATIQRAARRASLTRTLPSQKPAPQKRCDQAPTDPGRP